MCFEHILKTNLKFTLKKDKFLYACYFSLLIKLFMLFLRSHPRIQIEWWFFFRGGH